MSINRRPSRLAEAHQRQVAAFRHLHRQRGRRRHREQNFHTAHRRFLHHLIAGAAGNERGALLREFWHTNYACPDLELIESIRANDLLHPIVVWKQPDGALMILSGHNRVRAYTALLEKTGEDKYRRIPATVLTDITADEAHEIVVDSNYVQRVLTPSEKARSISQKYALAGRKKRSRNGVRKSKYEQIGEEYNLSARQIARYVRLGSLDGSLLKLLDGFAARHIVITGGEPCMYDLRELTAALLARGRSVQIETSGTHEVLCADGVWVTVSPKLHMPGGLPVLASAMRRANEVKHPVGKLADIEQLLGVLPLVPSGVQVWLQPLSQSSKATELCIAEATQRGWRVSVQTHKFLGVR